MQRDSASVEVIDLTRETDPEEQPESREGEVEDQLTDLPVLEEAGHRLVPIEEGLITSGQRCVRSLGRIRKPGPYWIPLGVHQGSGDLPR